MHKGDFTANIRLLWIAGLATAVGMVCALVAVALLWMIGLFTRLFYYPGDFFVTLLHHPSALLTLSEVAPAGSHLGWVAMFAPVVGGLAIGLMARYGSDRIRGHGIPEAIEAILIGRSRMSRKVAVLKPLSSAISRAAISSRRVRKWSKRNCAANACCRVDAWARVRTRRGWNRPPR